MIPIRRLGVGRHLSLADKNVMKAWFFYISHDEIVAVADDLLERHGDDAQDEALRLADVGRRIGSRRNSSMYRRAAQHLAGDCRPGAGARDQRAWLARIERGVREFGAPRVPTEQAAPSGLRDDQSGRPML